VIGGSRAAMTGDDDAKEPICHTASMTDKALKDIMQRVESWPLEAQEELAEIVREMDASLHGGSYRAFAEELAGIDRGLKAAREGRFTSDEEVEEVFAKHRGR